jgi:hypothetical protein
MTMKCIKERCYSPVACGGFGYCREMNFTEGRHLQRDDPPEVDKDAPKSLTVR